LNASGIGTAAQGISFSSANGTTGNLINFSNGGTNCLDSCFLWQRIFNGFVNASGSINTSGTLGVFGQSTLASATSSNFQATGTLLVAGSSTFQNALTQSGGTVSLASTTVAGSLTLTSLGTAGNNVLTANSSGVVATTTYAYVLSRNVVATTFNSAATNVSTTIASSSYQRMH